MAQFACFTAHGITPHDRPARPDTALWNPSAPFRIRSGDVPYDCGTVHLLRMTASADPAAREGGRVQPGLVLLIVQRHGTAAIAQSGRRIVLEPGSWTICDADRAYAVENDADGEQIVLFMPRERLGGGSGLATYFMQAFGNGGGTARLLPRYLAGLADEIGQVDEGNCSELADMAAQLVRLALVEVRNAEPGVSMRETMRLRVKDYVRRNLRDPGLTIDRVAAAFGCTKRHLHKVFNQDAMTLSQFIWSQRLDACRDALRNPALARMSITEVAFMWGFNNSAHFSKTFKDRFGCPPGHYRAQARQPAAALPDLETAA